jgi:hypothetical protein
MPVSSSGEAWERKTRHGPQNAQSNTPAAMMRYGFDWLPWVVRNQSVRVLSIRQARRKDFSFGVENPTTIGS